MKGLQEWGGWERETGNTWNFHVRVTRSDGSRRPCVFDDIFDKPQGVTKSQLLCCCCLVHPVWGGYWAGMWTVITFCWARALARHVLFVLITYYRKFMELIFQLTETILCNPDLQVTPLKSGTDAHTRAMPLQTHMCWHPGTHRDVSPHLPTCTERLSIFLPPEVILSDSRWSLAPTAFVNSNNNNNNNNSNNDKPHGLPTSAKSLKEQRKYLGLAKCVSGI